MSQFVREIEQRRWRDDVDSHARLTEMRLGMSNPRTAEIVDRRITEIEARWPQHFKSKKIGASNG